MIEERLIDREREREGWREREGGREREREREREIDKDRKRGESIVLHLQSVYQKATYTISLSLDL